MASFVTRFTDYHRSRKDYEAFLKQLSSEGARVLDLSKIVYKIIEAADLVERLEIIKLIWDNQRLAPRAEDLTADSVLFGYPATPTFSKGKTTMPDFVRASTYARDIGFMLPSGLVVSRMRVYGRREQPRVLKLALLKDPILADKVETMWDAYSDGEMALREATIEGGDVQVLSEEIVACGIGQMTSFSAFDALATRLLSDRNQKVAKVVGVRLPRIPMSNFAHLDTTIGYFGNKGAVVMPYIYESHKLRGMPRKRLLVNLFMSMRNDLLGDGQRVDVTPDPQALASAGTCVVYERTGSGIAQKSRGSFIDFLIDHQVIEKDNIALVGNEPKTKDDVNHLVSALQEQHAQAANILCLRPGVVLGYQRNRLTTEALKQKGVTVKVVEDGFLDKSGGPHCLTMPLDRGAG